MGLKHKEIMDNFCGGVFGQGPQFRVIWPYITLEEKVKFLNFSADTFSKQHKIDQNYDPFTRVYGITPFVKGSARHPEAEDNN